MSKEKNLIQGQIPSDLKAVFDKQLDDQGFNVGRIVEALARLWTHLPYDTQTLLYRRGIDDKVLSEIIETIVDKKIREILPEMMKDAIRSSGKDLRDNQGRHKTKEVG